MMLRLMLPLLGFLALPAEAQQTVAFKCPAPGTTMETPGTVITFIRQEGMTCHSKRADGNGIAWMGGATAAASPQGTALKSALETLWPAKVGGTTGLVRGSGNWTYEVTVRERKMLTVPAGTFDVLVIEVLSDAGRNIHKATTRIYYAPDLGYHVKLESTLERGVWPGPAPIAFEAVKITKP